MRTERNAAVQVAGELADLFSELQTFSGDEHRRVDRAASDEEWLRHGRLHRTDGPAVIHANGSVKYYVDGVRHRDGGPACVYVNGTEKWYREGKRHREDGPAAIYPDGRRIWFIEGEKVREERRARQPSLVKAR